MRKVIRVEVNPNLIKWARERANIPQVMLKQKFPKIEKWESGELKPTLKQLERFAKVVNVPFGYLFFKSPPPEKLPIKDFRINRNKFKPDPNLLETIYICQQRQDWYKTFLKKQGELPLKFVGSLSLDTPPQKAAKIIRDDLKYSIDVQKRSTTWQEHFKSLVNLTEKIGILVMGSSIVSNNTRRKLDPSIFKGFTLIDAYAPLIFINTADYKSSQIFTLAHELAHIWLGISSISDVDPGIFSNSRIEKWCSQVASEFLVPGEELKDIFRYDNLNEEVSRLAKIFKVSTLVIIRRLYEINLINKATFINLYSNELEKVKKIERRETYGGNFYSVLLTRSGVKFSRAIIESTIEGHTLFKEALNLLGIKSVRTFFKFAKYLGIYMDEISA